MVQVTQTSVDLSIPMGANLVVDQGLLQGATFRVWAPLAKAVYLNGRFNGSDAWDRDANQSLALQRIMGGSSWGGFVAAAQEGDAYKFYVMGEGTSGYKRDPYARERQGDGNCLIRNPAAYPWHDQDFRPPAFNDMVIYQLHVGSFFRVSGTGEGTFLDVIEKIPYLAALGVNVVQMLPVTGFETTNSEGYNGSDCFAPEYRYALSNPTAPVEHLATANRLLTARNKSPVPREQVMSPYSQLKLLVDVCHVYGIAVHFDVVYNHAGGFDGDDESIFFWDREQGGDDDRSLYFTAQAIPPGGLPFSLWKAEVREFLIDNACYLAREFHADGFRYDLVSLLVEKNGSNGWRFCQDITSTLRFLKPEAFHNAEYWPVNPMIVAAAANGGAGFDGTQDNGLREAVRGAVSQAAGGGAAAVDMGRLASHLQVFGFPAQWKAVRCVENHDAVFQGKGQRISRLADPSDARSWYARSRSRVALGLLLTAPGIPQLFMGQEFLEDKQWSDDPASPLHLYWEGLARGEKPMVDFLRFSQDLIWLRRREPALRGETSNVFHSHNGNRVIAFHRWIEGEGHDVVVVASLSETTFHGYRLGFPGGGRWAEMFNSDVYDHWVNPGASGNGGQVYADALPTHGFGYSAGITIPAAGILIFAR